MEGDEEAANLPDWFFVATAPSPLLTQSAELELKTLFLNVKVLCSLFNKKSLL
jgi:hypothetical protein